MPPLALISNPPFGEDRRRELARRNPLTFSGPSLTFAPFSSTPVSIDLLGVGYQGARKNPPSGAGTVVFNVFTEEARRYPNPPLAAVSGAWRDDGGDGYTHVAGSFVRSGPWMARVATRSRNPAETKVAQTLRSMRRSPSGGASSTPFADVDYDLGKTLQRAWAFRTLELMWQVKQPGNPGYEDQPRRVQPPAVLVNMRIFFETYAREAADPDSSDPRKRLGRREAPQDAVGRAFERWKNQTRAGALERPDVYTIDHPRGVWFAFDALAAFDLAWAVLGSPHPLDNLTGWEYHPQHETGHGYPRELELLDRAILSIDPDDPATAALDVELGLERSRAVDIHGGATSSTLDRTSFRGVGARRFAVEPDFRSRAARLRAWTAPVETLELGQDPPETEWELWRQDRDAWRIERDRAIRERRPVPPPPLPPGQRPGQRRVMPAVPLEVVPAAAAPLALTPVPTPIPPPPQRPSELPGLIRALATRAGTLTRAASLLGVNGSTLSHLAAGRVMYVSQDTANRLVARIHELLASDLVPVPQRRPGRTPRATVAPWREALERIVVRGWSQSGIAERLGVAQATVHNWSGGRHTVPPPELQRRLVEFDASGVVPPSRARDLRVRATIPEDATAETMRAIGRLWRGGDRELERAAGLKPGWLQRARKGEAQYGRAYDSWRKLQRFLETLATQQGQQLEMFRLNPGLDPQAATELARLTDPNRERRRNPDTKWKTPPKRREVSVEEARQLLHARPPYDPGLGRRLTPQEIDERFEQAQKRVARFHGRKPTKAWVYEIPNGQKQVTFDPDVYAALHHTIEVPYQVDWDSSKRGDNAKKPIVWFHEFPRETRPMKVLNPRTNITSDVGGTYLIDDYWYS